MEAEATAAWTLVVIVAGHLWARCFSVDEEKYLDRKLIRAYTCTFAFSKKWERA
jgi:Na+/proline symporter